MTQGLEEEDDDVYVGWPNKQRNRCVLQSHPQAVA